MYPEVVGEFETLRELLRGGSIARFGDGELKVMEGRGYVREPANIRLSDEIWSVMRKPHTSCLIGIPTMDPDGPKYANWARHRDRFLRHVRADDGRRYYSAFISRPDSAAESIETGEYLDLFLGLWAGQQTVAVVSEASSKLLTAVRATNSGDTVHIECPSQRAYAEIDELERAVRKSRAAVALLSCGPTATCLANRLAAVGVRGLDLGSVGAMLMRLIQRGAEQSTVW